MHYFSRSTFACWFHPQAFFYQKFIICSLFSWLLCSTLAWSNPIPSTHAIDESLYVPASNSSIVLQLPDEIAPLHEQELDNLSVIEKVLSEAEKLLTLGKQQAEPRYADYAQAIVNRVINNDVASPYDQTAAQLLLAEVLDYQHDFSGAQDAAEQVVQNGNILQKTQAYLLLSNLALVQGNIELAGDYCDAMRISNRQTQQAYPLCVIGVYMRSGQSNAALAQIARIESSAATEEIWLQQTKAELYAQTLHPKTSEQFARAWQVTLQSILDPHPTNPTIHNLNFQILYADWLLDNQQASKALTVLETSPNVVITQLRKARAAQQLQQSYAKLADDIEDYLQRSTQRGDVASQREAAYYHVFISGNATAALTAAEKNWQLQKEPIDVRLLLMAADAANQPEAANVAQNFIQQTGLQDARLPTLNN